MIFGMCLNSTMVRLKLATYVLKRLIEFSLNSTMVRLKLFVSLENDGLKLIESQFHYGSIKTTNLPINQNFSYDGSQFHYGSIKTILKIC